MHYINAHIVSFSHYFIKKEKKKKTSLHLHQVVRFTPLLVCVHIEKLCDDVYI